MDEDILTIVPVKLGPKNESIVSVLGFLDKFVQEGIKLRDVTRVYYLSFVVDPPEMVELLEKEIKFYETVRPSLWPVVVNVWAGKGSYGSSLSRTLSYIYRAGTLSTIITELGDGLFLNNVLNTATWWTKNPLKDKYTTLVFSRYGVPPNIFYFPIDEGRDHSSWFRRLGRRFVGWIFNLLITSRFGWQNTLDGATHASRIYNGHLFESSKALKSLLDALEGRNPQSSNIILLAWALSQKDHVVLSKPSEYHPTNSTLNFWGVVETFAMLFEIWYTTRILRRDWKGIVPGV